MVVDRYCEIVCCSSLFAVECCDIKGVNWMKVGLGLIFVNCRIITV